MSFSYYYVKTLNNFKKNIKAFMQKESKQTLLSENKYNLKNYPINKC